ncbi:MAG: outer membrane protein assembly factor BamD [Verrucomicrobiota bacterium]
MRKPLLLLSLVLALAAPAVPTASASLIYRAGEGWSAEDEDAGTAEKSASEQLHKAQAFETGGDAKKAVGAYRTLIRKWPTSGVASECQFKIAQLLEEGHELDRAFDAYGKYISTYPQGAQFDKAVESQYKIAVAFLNGEKRTVFGVKTFSSMERAQKMFEEIVKNAPFSKWAALSQFNIGQAQEKQGDDTAALAAYQIVVDKYNGEDVAADALYQTGYIYLKLTKKGSNDQGSRTKAREAFEDYLMRYPQSEKAAQVKENLATLSGTDVKQTLGVAQFYERTKNYKAAAIYYNAVISTAADSPEGEIAKKRLDGMKKSVGEDNLRAGPERAETGAKVKERRKLQSQVDTAARPDYAGPPAPVVPDEVAPAKPKLRTAGDADAGPLPPAPEPSLPSR